MTAPRWWTHVVARRLPGGNAELELTDGRSRVVSLMGDFHTPAWSEAASFPALWWTAGALLYALTGSEDTNDPRRDALLGYLRTRNAFGWQATAGDLALALYAGALRATVVGSAA